MSYFTAIRSCEEHLVDVYAAEYHPGSVQPAISVQTAWNGSRGIIRGLLEHGLLVEDHIDQMLDANGRLVDAPHRIAGPEPMRRQVWTIDDHLRAWHAANPERKVVGIVGNGNLLSNGYFVGGSRGNVYCLAGEFDSPPREYDALVVWRDGGSRRVTIQVIDPRAPLPGVECFTTGQRLVKGGVPLDTLELSRLARGRQFSDLRQLLLFGRAPIGENRWIDCGLGTFWPRGMDVDLLEKAVLGDVVELDVRQFDSTAVRSAMADKDYMEVSNPVFPGQYMLQGGRLRVVFYPSVYPHNLIGLRDDGTILSVVVGGLSNRVGITLLSAARLMVDLGCVDALLLDNGGDVQLWFDGRPVLGSSDAGRNRLRSILLFVHDQDARISIGDARLITFPKQKCGALAPRNPGGDMVT